MRELDKTDLAIPDFALVVLIGSTGSGKSTFAARHFLPTEIISSDQCRALVSDDETDQDVSADAFDLVREIAGKRLKHRRLAVIDATNVRAADRKAWIELARKWHALPVAVVLDPGVEVCVARNAVRADRPVGAGVAQRMTTEIRKGLGGLQREGFRQVWTLYQRGQHRRGRGVAAAAMDRQARRPRPVRYHWRHPRLFG
ncbi:AAA family ATPase [Mesorhizobium sp. M1217]|uniref:AAA family ATPase n=1 Tax=Mesorhizobium sp. M1217 TaxID=2957070 RepID=UPI00333CDE4C